MNEKKVSNRQAICETLMEMAKEDKDIVVLTSDSRGSGSLAPFVQAFPDQHVEVGIAEQNIVGIAAGLAAIGKKPIATSPASFLSARSFEQIKVDVAYSHMPVVLYGISGGVSYGALGMTHHSLQDIAAIGAIPGIDVILPADRFESAAVFRELMEHPRPAYVRIGRNAVEDVFEDGDARYVPGKATVVHEGKDAAIIATGEMVRTALDAAILLEKEGISVRVLDMHTIKPLDEEAIAYACETGFVVTMEEHSKFGGLGSRVAAYAAEEAAAKVRVLAIPDEPAVAGKSKEVFAYYKLDTDNVVRIIMEEKKR